MGLMENAIDQAFARMSREDKADLLTTVATRLLEKLNNEDRYALADKIVDTLLGNMTMDERQEAMREFLPRMIARAVEQSGMSVSDLMNAAMASLTMMEQREDNAASANHH